jgi:hypothetical protein
MTSNERKDKHGPHTVFEYPAQGAKPAAPARPQTTFGVAPAASVPPYDPRKDPHFNTTQPLGSAFVAPKQEQKPQVSVGRVQGIGQEPARAAEPARPAQSFARTVIAAGHRIEAPAVPAYPTPPPVVHEKYQSEERPKPSFLVDTMPSARVDPAPVAREPTQIRDQHALTASVDVTEFMKKYPVRMPQLGGTEDSSSAWTAPSEPAPPQPSAEPAYERSYERTPLPRRAEKPRAPEDADVPGVSSNKMPLILTALGVALSLIALSIYVKSTRSVEPVPESAPVASNGIPAPAPLADVETPPAQPAPQPAQQVAQPQATNSAGSVTPASAAALYINGQYKEALAEYRLLARANPQQAVYGELVRILRRKLIDTCTRTQPHRREQCREI